MQEGKTPSKPKNCKNAQKITKTINCAEKERIVKPQACELPDESIPLYCAFVCIRG